MTTAFCPTDFNYPNGIYSNPQSLADSKQLTIQLNQNSDDMFLPELLSKKRGVQKEIKKQLELRELNTQYKNKEIGFFEYAGKYIAKKVSSFLTATPKTKDYKREASKKLKLQKLKQKYENGEISKVNYSTKKLGTHILYGPKPQIQTTSQLKSTTA